MVADAARLRTLALTDDLTGLHNLRSFETELAGMVHASRQQQTPLALLVLDLDRLKSLNDRHGHLTGAEAVRLVGRIIADCVPPGGVACRYGGDEFAIAIPRCAPDACRAVADTLRTAVHASAPLLAGHQFPRGTLSISVGAACRIIGRSRPGVATATRDIDDGEALFRRGDDALYRAKGGGRNRVWIDAAEAAESA
jgi:diguanylate cyclase (GGDEF)-like protein